MVDKISVLLKTKVVLRILEEQLLYQKLGNDKYNLDLNRKKED